MRLLTLLFVFPWFCFSQEYSGNVRSDSLFIKLSEATIGNQVLIDKINIYGDSLKNENSMIRFLFTNKKLLSELEKLDTKKTYRDSLAKIGIIRIPGGSRPTFGIMLSYFSMDFKTVRKKVKYFNEHVAPIEKLEEKNKDLSKKNIQKFRQELFENLGMPLTSSFFANKDYFENKKVFVYEGTDINLQELKNEIKKAGKIFILLPLCGVGIDYQVLQVI